MSGINQTRAIPAGTHAVWCGDSVTQGTGASATAKRYSTLASGELNLTEHNYAKTTAGYLIDGNTISMQPTRPTRMPAIHMIRSATCS